MEYKGHVYGIHIYIYRERENKKTEREREAERERERDREYKVLNQRWRAKETSFNNCRKKWTSPEKAWLFIRPFKVCLMGF